MVHLRPGYPSVGCSPAEPTSVSPGALTIPKGVLEKQEHRKASGREARQSVAKEGLFFVQRMGSTSALELYLKSLNTNNVCVPDPDAPPGYAYMIFSRPNKFGHKLTEQYDELMPELRKELDDLYVAAPVVPNATTIREALATYDDLFVSSRYWFEPNYNRGGGRRITALINLVNLIGNYVEKLPKRVVELREDV
jgi:hypothetical protein